MDVVVLCIGLLRLDARETRGLVVLIKEDGRWKTVASQNTLIEATPDGNR